MGVVLQDRERSSFRYCLSRPGGKSLSTIYPVGKRSLCNLQATCLKHGRACRCWLTVPDRLGVSPDGVLFDIAKWVSMADKTEIYGHQKLAFELYEAYGVTPQR